MPNWIYDFLDLGHLLLVRKVVMGLGCQLAILN